MSIRGLLAMFDVEPWPLQMPHHVDLKGTWANWVLCQIAKELKLHNWLEAHWSVFPLSAIETLRAQLRLSRGIFPSWMQVKHNWYQLRWTEANWSFQGPLHHLEFKWVMNPLLSNRNALNIGYRPMVAMQVSILLLLLNWRVQLGHRGATIDCVLLINHCSHWMKGRHWH